MQRKSKCNKMANAQMPIACAVSSCLVVSLANHINCCCYTTHIVFHGYLCSPKVTCPDLLYKFTSHILSMYATFPVDINKLCILTVKKKVTINTTAEFGQIYKIFHKVVEISLTEAKVPYALLMCTFNNNSQNIKFIYFLS